MLKVYKTVLDSVPASNLQQKFKYQNFIYVLKT